MESTMSMGSPSPPTELSALLERLLDEAEAGEGSSSQTDSAVPATTPAPEAVTASTPPPSTGGGGFPLGALLANPALLSALPTLAENLGPLLGGGTGGIGSSPKATRPHTIDRHTALLCAVKPYLSPQRQSAAETVIHLCRIWDALERSGISLTGLLGGLGTAPPAGGASSDGEVT